MRFVLIAGLVFVLTFAASLAAVLAATGNLNADALNRILGRGGAPAPAGEQADELDAFAVALKQREQELTAQRKQLDEDKKRMRMAQEDLDELTKRLDQLLQQAAAFKQESDKTQETRLQQAAETLAKMDPKKAAAALADWPADRIAEVLRNVKEKERAKILDQMDPNQVAMVIDSLKRQVF